MTESRAAFGNMDLTNDVGPATALKRRAAERIARATVDDLHSTG